ncbi:integration host factor subunit alpha [Methylocystis sp. Sn-Cys]|uniref:integration host factor subunit alpha n=1 Tax=Methylocystis sp. Sn-Cys TaxID=1701263 RepID=UPI001FEF3C56|nr:integration host factor subunit alpha [Methylocystis sp. Sn-Cys]
MSLLVYGPVAQDAGEGAMLMSTADEPIKTRLKAAASSSEEQEESQRGALTRQDIALAIFERVKGISRREAKRLTDCVIDEMVSTLVSGETLKLHDFGSFVVREKHKRSGRNPRTGAPVPIDARRVVIFKASPTIKAAISGSTPRQGAKPSRRQPLAHSAGDMPSCAPTLEKE